MRWVRAPWTPSLPPWACACPIGHAQVVARKAMDTPRCRAFGEDSFALLSPSRHDATALTALAAEMMHILDLSIIAEGVETQEQHTLLQSMGCEEVQGYLHAKPMPAQDVAQWLAARR